MHKSIKVIMGKILSMLNFIVFFGSTFFGVILGYLFKTQIDHFLAIIRIREGIRITEYNKATSKLRSAFAPALAFIYLVQKHGTIHEVPDVDKFLKKVILRHASAVEEFRIFVPQSKGAAYQEAWEKYRYEVCNYGFETTTFRTDVDDSWRVFENLIHGILQFAEFEN
jgi:ABC-type antimicrobial peptide transport system permease subunit